MFRSIIKMFSRFVFILSVSFLFSCQNENTTTQTAVPDNRVLTNADGDYIQFPDAPKFLSDWKKENNLTVQWMQEPDNLHPCNGRTLSRAIVFTLIHRSLLSIDPMTRKLKADLVKEIPVSPDGLTYRFELKDEPAFDDGAQLTVDDVIFSFKAYTCPLVNVSGRSALNNLLNIVKDNSNARAFTVTMKKVLAQNLFILTDFPILEKKFYDADDALKNYPVNWVNVEDQPGMNKTFPTAWAAAFNDGRYGNDPALINGLGAYKVKSWERGQTLTLEKKKNHWTEKLSAEILNQFYPKQITFKIITDENTILLAARNQEFDASFWLPSKVLLELQKDSSFTKNYNSCYTASYDFSYIGFNMKPQESKRTDFFSDLNVRKAFAMLTPVDLMIQNLFSDKALRMSGIVSPLKKDIFNDDLKSYAFNIDEAKKLLSNAGWKDSDGDKILDKIINGKKTDLKVELIFPLGPSVIQDMALMLKDVYAKAGIDLQPQVLDPNALGGKMVSHDFDLFMSGLSSSSAPSDYTGTWSTAAWLNHENNFTGFGSAASDALIDSINVTLDEANRAQLEKEFQKMVYDNYPIIPLYFNVKKIVVHKRWANAIVCFDKPYILFGQLELLSEKKQPE